MRAVLTAFFCLWASLAPLGAQDLSALARFDPAASALGGGDGTLSLTLAISQPVPWRVRLLDAPPRLILDTREVDWTGVTDLATPLAMTDLRAGTLRPGWTRLVVQLSGPHLVTRAEMATEGTTLIRLTLTPAIQADFAAAAALPEPPGWDIPDAAALPPPAVRGDGPVVVVLDPGHGGIDPGAEAQTLRESDLMLAFARELKDLLAQDPQFRVVLTRDDDSFVPLESRISIARAAGGHLFVSLHADALAEGEAQGATVYTLSEEASDEAAQAMAERHDRDDLLAGVDLTAQDDIVATVLMDMARAETEPRTDRLAAAVVGAIQAADLRMHRQPRQQAGFSVLKSPEIPSILLELGFLSSSRDLKRLTDADWRAKMAEAVRQGLTLWAAEDAALRALRDG